LSFTGKFVLLDLSAAVKNAEGRKGVLEIFLSVARTFGLENTT
jgi:hypothetical protein